MVQTPQTPISEARKAYQVVWRDMHRNDDVRYVREETNVPDGAPPT